jgi:tmRNA-binding protein
MTNKPQQRRFWEEFCTQKMNANKTMRGWEVSNRRRRKSKYSESSIDLTTHNQILIQQKQPNAGNLHTPININTECQQTQLLHQKTLFGKLD